MQKLGTDGKKIATVVTPAAKDTKKTDSIPGGLTKIKTAVDKHIGDKIIKQTIT